MDQGLDAVGRMGPCVPVVGVSRSGLAWSFTTVIATVPTKHAAATTSAALAMKI